VTGADLHGAPDLVLAPQRLTCDMSVGRMELSVMFRFLRASGPSRMNMNPAVQSGKLLAVWSR
jgi:hypothetical protein